MKQRRGSMRTKGAIHEGQFTHQALQMMILLGALWMACANPIAPTGGPKDETPPKLDSLKSTPGLQTDFKPREIELSFDEWIKLDNPSQQILISPPLNKRPKIELRGKTVKISLDKEEILRENVTYTIQFGEAIKDLNEGNILRNFRYVFSTGPVLDSLTLTGKAVKAYEQTPYENITVMLHQTATDSVVVKETPYYFARTNKQGFFRFENIAAGDYKIFALNDANQNYKFDNLSEETGFLKERILVPQENLSDSALTLSLFTQPLNFRLLENNHYRQVSKLVFNRPPGDVSLAAEEGLTLNTTFVEEDTLWVWHDTLFSQTVWHLQSLPDYFDTVKVYRDSVKWFTSSPRITLASRNTLYPGHPVEVLASQPVIRADSSRIGYLDSIGWVAVPVTIDSVYPYRLLLKYPWLPDKRYRVVFLPNALLTSAYNPHDTLKVDLNFANPERFGGLNLHVTGLDSASSYVLNLVVDNKVVRQEKISLLDHYKVQWLGLEPGQIHVHIFEDKNGNGRWDPGHYWRYLYPEPIKWLKIENLKANWTVDNRINWSSGQ